MAGQLPRRITDAIVTLSRHSCVLDISAPQIEASGLIVVNAQVTVSLPSRAKAKGESASGVRAIEPIRFEFAATPPMLAPVIGLRKDFPLTLPHINPHSPGSWVRPCIFAGSLTELMYREGLAAVVDQLLRWLQRAASGALIDPNQGWEYVRRDEAGLVTEFDADRLTKILPWQGGVVELSAEFTQLDESLRVRVFDRPLRPRSLKYETSSRRGLYGDVHQVASLALLAAPAVIGATGTRPVFDVYAPETVKTVDDLIEKARYFNIDGGKLLVRLNDFYGTSLRQSRTRTPWPTPFRVVVILAVQRPYALISSHGNSVEFLTYVLQQETAARSRTLKTAQVRPAIHIQGLSSKILRSTSGTETAAAEARIAWLGVGSLGSKIALHLAKSGFNRHTFIDSDSFSPHNEARHALWNVSDLGRMLPKAVLMSANLNALTEGGTEWHVSDAIELLSSAKAFGRILAPAKLIVDSTASMAVMEAACLSPAVPQFASRYVRTAMLARGAVCFVALEGHQRATRIDDLMGHLYARCRVDDALRTRLSKEPNIADELYVGQSCSSFTTVMPDSRISRSAASVAMKLESWLHQGVPRDGALSVGIEDVDGAGMQWTTYTVPTSTVLTTESDGGWEIRVISPVANTIENEARHWGRHETGGALLAHVYPERRTIVIADVIDAPEDSKRTPSHFTLGVKGLETSLQKAHRDTCGHLRYIGTWHSHPSGGALSSTDINTLKALASEACGLPMLVLVWTPRGLLCKVATQS